MSSRESREREDGIYSTYQGLWVSVILVIRLWLNINCKVLCNILSAVNQIGENVWRKDIEMFTQKKLGKVG